MLHVFVYVVRSTHDHFSGIRKALNSEGQNRIVNLHFDEQDLDLIDRVEYTERRFFRAFYYPRIFRRLCLTLDQTIALADENEPVNIYFADEGVWAVVWTDYRLRYRRDKLRAINVQHGLAVIRRIRFLAARRFINMLSRVIAGFPSLGYGSLGGAGPAAFDCYLTYDAHMAEHIQQKTRRLALPAPRLIKHDLIKSFFSIRDETEVDSGRILFALNKKMRGSPIKCDMEETLDELLELAMEINKLGAELVLRLHPGMDREVEAQKFNSHPISRFATLDPYISLQQSMASSTMVLSFLSSVLWEGSILGLVSVQVQCKCCSAVELPFEHYELKLDADLTSQLKDLLVLAQEVKLQNWRQMEQEEWLRVRPALIQEAI